MRIASWNINSITARLPRLTQWLESAQPDVVCLQELKVSADAFPGDELRALGYESVVSAGGRWNGVAVLSRVGMEDQAVALPGVPEFDGIIEARAAAATCGGVRVWSVYVPNGREVGHPHYEYKLQWLAALRDTVGEWASGPLPFAVLGDFNIAPTDEDVWDISAFDGATHVTAREREKLAELEAAGTKELHPRALKYDVAFTYWDYRQLGFPKNRGMRIDLAYGNEPFMAAVKDSYVDREARKGKGASDHAPVVIDLEV
ncbi:exodeoxyribonuclease III [Streptomyces iconiensis]|uniref:Exodeoxyribonuclease III n=1 Tax=Streptomyces iconiensis TaxID=1384038 RepID=A0ABT6ZUT2_9ACTN|nr:exodeoxyribonuclease III [Streptomyces iconiensis]MDJ1132813.1 exodeoxyribonuclease III [Streptomyces iconiensis]